ncbi:DUF2000 domain-containing protein [Subtercola sp. YIM 133946]|uniref:DUF2000 domain-containing protein n=1 Tax=Subtercola sp. YIM 133946 TaxID=3118909 RepID=UPI002F957955
MSTELPNSVSTAPTTPETATATTTALLAAALPAPTAPVGFEPHEMVTAESTRSARLKWVIIVDRGLPPGLAVNAAACIAASVGSSVAGLIGPAGLDAEGSPHPGLPWAGCSVLGASPEELLAVRAAAGLLLPPVDAGEGVYVTDMPLSAQTNRVYDGYLAELATTAAPDLALSALSLIGPRKAIDKLTKRLTLL